MMRSSKPRRRVSVAPEGQVIFAVGDIHGAAELLSALLQQIAVEAEVEAARGRTLVLVFLGNYIDRGPHTAQVLATLRELRRETWLETIFLRGNHEDMLLRLLDGQDPTARWWDSGGGETLKSYSAPAAAVRHGMTSRELRDAAAAILLPEDVEFLRATDFRAELGDYVFVHGGLHPKRPLEEQSPGEMMWLRYGQADPEPVWPGVVVHGHGAGFSPQSGLARIGIDTQAWRSGVLTAVRLAGADRHFVRAEFDASTGEIKVGLWQGDFDTPRIKTAAASRRWPRQALLFAGLTGLCLTTTIAALNLEQRRILNDLASETPDQVLGATPPPQVAPPDTRPALAEAEPPAPAAETPSQGAAAVKLRPLGRAGPAGLPPFLSEAPAPAALAPAALAPAVDAGQVPSPNRGPRSGEGFRVQIGAVSSEAAAQTLWDRTRQAVGLEAAGKGLSIAPVETARGRLYRVQVLGFEDRADAQRFCLALPAQTPCLLVAQD